jgi:hypothetical protein
MATFNPVYTSPRTEAQLREILAKLRQSLLTIEVDVTGLEEAILPSVTAAANIAARDVVYVSAAGTVNLARADALATSKAFGIAPAAIASAATGTVLTVGIVTSTGWGLTANTIYYLSPTVAGGITATAPSTPGQYIVPVGLALSSTQLMFNPQSSILL